ncbi:MAG TPA: rod shape-determining protein MreD [Gammaproteobacteria bacterium]|nr:rod shape-determining protein MreD [Gammaproteobacteria bacterium]
MTARAHALWIPALTFVVALVLTIWPLPAWAEAWRPHWAALTLIYWCLALPNRINIGVAWLVGVVLDVLHGALLGQHALALVLVAFLANRFHLQIRVFPVLQQTVAVTLLLAVYAFVLFWISGATGVEIGFHRYIPALLTSALLWPWTFAVLRHLRRTWQVG